MVLLIESLCVAIIRELLLHAIRESTIAFRKTMVRLGNPTNGWEQGFEFDLRPFVRPGEAILNGSQVLEHDCHAYSGLWST